MIRRFYALALSVALLASGLTCFGQQQMPAPNSDKWVDYASGDYDILPNLTYSMANNIELKLDLYLPRKRSTL